MITTIINALFSLSLFVTGGHIVSTNLKLHHYSDDDYKEIFHLKNKASISKNCTRHNEVEDIKKTRHSSHNGLQETKYKIIVQLVFHQLKYDHKSETILRPMLIIILWFPYNSFGIVFLNPFQNFCCR